MAESGKHIIPFAKPPLWNVDNTYPRRKGWHNTKTYWSPNVTGVTSTFPIPSSRHIASIIPCRRQWNTGGINARTTSYASDYDGIDLTTPCYMLAGTDTTSDNLVGLDYNNLPITLDKKVREMALLWNPEPDTDLHPNSLRVLAINHELTLMNYSRFPMEIYYELLPMGYQFDVFTTTSAPMPDLTYSALNKVVIPGVRDAGDKANTRTIKIAGNLRDMFPFSYDMNPGFHSSSGATGTQGSPWIIFNPETVTPELKTRPPGQQIGDPADDISVGQVQYPGLQMRMYGRIQGNFDMGSTAEGAGSGGTVVVNSLEIHANMNWLVETMVNARHPVAHPGGRAYPNQTA